MQTIVHGDMDCQTEIMYFPGMTVKEIKEKLDLPMEYKDDGWVVGKNSAGKFYIKVEVGCACSFDCCGHLCSLRYDFHMDNWHGWIVVARRSYNY